MGLLIAITGTPGTGKTFLAKFLESMGIGKILPREILERAVVGYDEILQTKIVDERLLSKEIKNFLEKNNGIYIFDSHLSHFSPREFTILYVLLRCDPNELRKRLKERGWDDLKIIHNVMAEEFGLIKKELEEMGVKFLEFWTDKQSVEEIANKIKEELERCLRGLRKK